MSKCEICGGACSESGCDRRNARGGAPVCHICGKPATCIGRYDNMKTDEPACDDCCGHGCEDGHCEPIEAKP